MAYVYAHYRKDDGKLFYIGVGKSGDNYKRAGNISKRNTYWRNVYNKHGRSIEILYEHIDYEDALKIEEILVAKFGRLCNNSGILTNITVGGRGCLGFPITDEYRKKCSAAQKGCKKWGPERPNPFQGKTHTSEVKAKISAALKATDKNKGANNPGYGIPRTQKQKEYHSNLMKGRKLTEEHKANISKGGKGIPKSEEWIKKISGVNNGWFGKGYLKKGDKGPAAKPCIFIETGEEFGSLITGCEIKKLSYNTQRAYLKRQHPNRKFNWK